MIRLLFDMVRDKVRLDRLTPVCNHDTLCSTVFHLGYYWWHQMPTSKRRVAVNPPGNEFDDTMAIADNHDVSVAWRGRQTSFEFIIR